MAVGVAAEVKSKLSVVDVVGQTVQLKKSGSTYKGLCPFHGEKTASFDVTPARESWKCFGCGLGGDIFSFVMQRDSVSFPEALKSWPRGRASSSTSGPVATTRASGACATSSTSDLVLSHGPDRPPVRAAGA